MKHRVEGLRHRDVASDVPVLRGVVGRREDGFVLLCILLALEDGKRFPQDAEPGVILIASFVEVRVSSESDAQDTLECILMCCLPLVGLCHLEVGLTYFQCNA